MAGDYMIRRRSDGLHIGRVTHFRGNPPGEKWVAFARRVRWTDPEMTKTFNTRREAIAYLEAEAERLGNQYETV